MAALLTASQPIFTAVSNLTNPKMAVFFPSLLPQFAPSGHSTFAALLTLGLVFCVMTLGAWE